jgi:hypothetical protein
MAAKGFVLGLLLAAAQDPDAELARRCDSRIPWISDGTELIDLELAAGHHPQYPEARRPRNFDVNRLPLLEKARAEAAARKRLILLYCPRTAGLHMYRATLPDRYMRIAVFTDPAFVDLVRAKFVPLRLVADEKIQAALDLKPFGFVEPGFVVLTPEGKVVHRIDRLRTFNADWFRAVLRAVLRAHPEYNRPAGESVADLLRGGDDEEAFGRASTEERAEILHRAGRFEEVLALEASPLRRGLALLGLKRFDEARRMLERAEGPEALYHLAAIDAWTGKDPGPRLRALARAHPDSPWGWRAAANAVPAEDSLPLGPMAHHLEDFFLRPPAGTPTDTRRPATDAEAAARDALDFLLRAQREDGGWRDARYAYWPDPEILPNVWGAVTALAAWALWEWRDLAPGRAEDALRRADAYLRDDRRLAPGRNEECYAQAFRLRYFAARGDVAAMGRVVARLAAIQDAAGHWAHEYPNPFSTAVVVLALHEARRAGAEVPEALFRRAAEALLSKRGDRGRQPYRVEDPGPDSEKNSMSRSALCERALQACGRASRDDVAAAVESFWKFADRLEAVRLCDYHSDGRLAGFFYFHAYLPLAEAIRSLGPGPASEAGLDRIRRRILAVPEWDGSFLDSHEIGKSYGTAAALLILRRATRP